MKKTLFILLAVLYSAVVFADDIIITKDSRRINAKIEKIDLETIEYRTTDNIDGPLQVIAKADVVSILYENGTVQVFDNQEQSSSQESSRSTSARIVKNYGPWGLHDIRIENTTYDNSPIIVRGNDVFQNGLELNQKQVFAMMQEFCPEAYKRLRISNGLEYTGAFLLVFGGTFTLTGGILWGILDSGVGMGLCLGGLGMCVTSVPPLVGASILKKQSYTLYNSNCAADVSYGLVLDKDGIGLAINF